MQRIASHIILRVNLLFLTLLSSFALAGNSAPEDYLVSKPLVLEVRYCECQATNLNSAPTDLLPSFLENSSLLKVGVSEEDKGFVSSSEFSIGYDLKPITGSPGQFHFNYAANYTTGSENYGGSGRLLLVQGQWVNVFGSQQEKEAGSQYSDVAVRLILPGGS